MKKGVIGVIIAALLWSLLPAIANALTVRGVDALSAAMMRASVAAIMFWLISIKHRPLMRFKKSDIGHFALMGLLAVTGTYSFYLLAIERLNFAMAAILLYTAPAFVTLFSRLIYKEPITKRKAIALALTFAGCFLVVKAYDFSQLKINAIGLLFGLGSGLCYSMLTVLGRRRMAEYGSQLSNAYMTVFGALFFMFIRPPWTIPMPSGTVFLLYVMLALIGSVLPYSLYMGALQTGLDGADASIVATIEPVFVALIGATMYHQSLAALQIVGIALTLGGACLSAMIQPEANADKNH